jgi:AraC family transcriptional regulator
MMSSVIGDPIPCVKGHGAVLDELRVDGIGMRLVHYAAGLTIHHHTHDLAKLTILLSGGATERAGENLVEHESLAVVARSRFRIHENQYHASGAHALIVELEDVPALPGALPAEVARHHGLSLVRAFRAARSARARRVRAAVGDLLEAFHEAPPVRTPAWLEHARAQLFAQLASPPRLEDLARTVGVHHVHLAQAFRRRWSMTPLGYVRAHRVFRAVDLLARRVPLAEIAAEVGFADQSHMTRVIGRARRASPGALRRTIHDAEPSGPARG